MSVSLSVTRFRCAKAAKQIEVLSGMENFADPWHIVLDGGPGPPTGRGGEGSGKENSILCTVYKYGCPDSIAR